MVEEEEEARLLLVTETGCTPGLVSLELLSQSDLTASQAQTVLPARRCHALLVRLG